MRPSRRAALLAGASWVLTACASVPHHYLGISREELAVHCQAHQEKVACHVLGQEQLKAQMPADAFKSFRMSCGLGSREGCYEAGQLYLQGKGVKADDGQATKLFDRACRERLPQACASLAELLRDRKRDYARSLELFDMACRADVGPACCGLGQQYHFGQGVDPDFGLALRQYERGCDLEDGCSCLQQGFLVEKGRATDADPELAADLYERACELKERLGCANLGYFLMKGIGRPKDERRAAELLSLACESGLMRSCAHLAMLVETRDPARSRELNERACQAGENMGCLNLGLKLSETRYFMIPCDRGDARGCLLAAQKNRGAAIPLYKKACDLENGTGCLNLGVAYRDGKGVGKDPKSAAALFEKGCELGEPWACGNLGIQYFKGEGVAKDAERARDLLEQGCDADDAEACDYLERLTPAAPAPRS